MYVSHLTIHKWWKTIFQQIILYHIKVKTDKGGFMIFQMWINALTDTLKHIMNEHMHTCAQKCTDSQRQHVTLSRGFKE